LRPGSLRHVHALRRRPSGRRHPPDQVPGPLSEAHMAERAETVRVTLRASFAAPGWHGERGDEVEVPAADARRMCARGLAAPVNPEEPTIKRMTAQEREQLRDSDHHEKVSEVLATRLGLQPTVPNRR